MKSRRRNIVLIAVISIGVIPLWELLFQSRISNVDKHAPLSFTSAPEGGAVLDCAALARDESVLIERIYLSCDPGGDHATRFLVDGGSEWMNVWDCELRWNGVREPVVVSPKIRQAYAICHADRLGLAAMLKVFRFRPKNGSTAAVAYRIEYRRGDTVIGEERFVLPPDFLFSTEGTVTEPSQQVREWFGIPSQLLAQVVSPEMIVRREAKQEPEAGKTPSATPTVQEARQP